MSAIANTYDTTGESFSNSVLLKTLSTSDLTLTQYGDYYNEQFTIYSGSAVKDLFDIYKAIYIQYTCVNNYNSQCKVVFKRSDYQYLKNLMKVLPNGSFTYLKQSMYYADYLKAQSGFNNYVLNINNYVLNKKVYSDNIADKYCVQVYANDANDVINGCLPEDTRVSGITFSGQVYGLK